MSLLDRLRQLENKFNTKTFNVLIVKDYENESLPDAKKRYEAENKNKLKSGEPCVHIHVKSDEQIRSRHNTPD